MHQPTGGGIGSGSVGGRLASRLGAFQLALAVAVIILDRGTKVWAVDWLYPRSPVPVTRFFTLTYVENTGAAFGMLQGANTFFIAVSVVLLGGLAWLRRRLPRERLAAQFALALVAGGALGNLYDRLRFGYVIDFLDFRVWPVFNVADSCISCGAVLLALLMGRIEEDAA